MWRMGIIIMMVVAMKMKGGTGVKEHDQCELCKIITSFHRGYESTKTTYLYCIFRIFVLFVFFFARQIPFLCVSCRMALASYINTNQLFCLNTPVTATDQSCCPVPIISCSPWGWLAVSFRDHVFDWLTSFRLGLRKVKPNIC